jgi:hypothetical protein
MTFRSPWLPAILLSFVSLAGCSDEQDEPKDTRPLSALANKDGINAVCQPILAAMDATDRRGLATTYCVIGGENRCEADIPACVADVEAEFAAEPLACDFDGDRVSAVLACDATVQELLDCLEGSLAAFDHMVGATCQDAGERAERLETDVCARLENQCQIFGDFGVMSVIR